MRWIAWVGLAVATLVPCAAQTPLGPAVRISDSVGFADAPELAANGRGDSVVVWIRWETEIGTSSIRGHTDPASGVPRDFVVAELPASRLAVLPTAVVADDGSFVVIWHESNRTLGADAAILARSFTAAGEPRTGAWTVAEAPDDGLRLSAPAAAGGPEGSVLVAWSASRGPGFDDFDSFGRWFAASGAPLSPAFALLAPRPGNQHVWSVAADGAGNAFALLLTDDAAVFPGLSTRLVGQRLGPDGERLGNEIWITPAASWDLMPRQVLWEEAGGGFRVVWAEWKRISPGEIFTRRFSADGEAIGPRVRLAKATTEGSIALLQDGGLVLVWQTEPGSRSRPTLLGRRFRASGKPAGPAFRVDNGRQGAPSHPWIAADPAGNLTVVWHNLPSTTPTGVFLRRFVLR